MRGIDATTNWPESREEKVMPSLHRLLLKDGDKNEKEERKCEKRRKMCQGLGEESEDKDRGGTLDALLPPDGGPLPPLPIRL